MRHMNPLPYLLPVGTETRFPRSGIGTRGEENSSDSLTLSHTHLYAVAESSETKSQEEEEANGSCASDRR